MNKIKFLILRYIAFFQDQESLIAPDSSIFFATFFSFACFFCELHWCHNGSIIGSIIQDVIEKKKEEKEIDTANEWKIRYHCTRDFFR